MANTPTMTATALDGQRRMLFHNRDSCTVLWPNGQPSLADLSDIFDRFGLRMASHRPVSAEPDEGGSAHFFTFERSSFGESALDKIADAFDAAISERTDVDTYSRLIGAADISWQEVDVIRAACTFLVQAQIRLSEKYIVDVVQQRPDFVRQVLALFTARFDPNMQDRDAEVAAAERALDTLVDSADTLDQDRILRGIRSFVSATLRTNWFQLDSAGRRKTYTSYKLDSRLLIVPTAQSVGQTIPYREIYVHAREVDGVHLRSSLVARGGLRFSERPEDYRTEALSLMKTQDVKNAPIVPSGAKGAFVVRGVEGSASPAAIRHAYSTFIRGLLDVTDNVVGGTIVRDPNTIAYDGNDTYLVVAADKGTAAFSDTANAIAQEYRYWLGDAFASGGSEGYDHKSMGITARGAWTSVRRHALEAGIDVRTDEFTVVGVGDMSGDVFGNGMLLSRTIKLIAAFDHRHIFIDPDPDPERSYAERRRLFDRAGSSWADYDRTLISDGGGVWPRSTKSIQLSESARNALGITAATATSHELIRAILSAPVDLLWNGGVGTYVKATSETHADAADPANDAVRINASSLRAAIVGEGGNLGFTQRARVEYARAGGAVNADFIDNAAGVATSDLEVNIKIALDAADLTHERRGALLSSVTDEVAKSVLDATSDQTLAISIAARRAPSLIDQHERLIEDLSISGSMNREAQALPDEKTFAERSRAGIGLVRPEIAVLVAQSKNMITGELLRSDVPDKAIFANRLPEYFPPPVIEAVGENIRSHRLGREIIATSLADELVNRVGPGLLFRLEERWGVRSPLATLAYAVVAAALGTETIRQDILNADLSAVQQLEALEKLQRILESEISWVLRRPGVSDRIALEPTGDIDRWTSMVTELGARGSVLDRLDSMHGILAVADTALQTGASPEVVVEVFSALAAELDLTGLLDGTASVIGTSHWEVMGGSAIHDRIIDRFAELASQAIDTAATLAPVSSAEIVSSWIDENQSSVQRFTDLMARVRRGGSLDTARLCTIGSELDLLLR